jgi:mono/diheme cytochrome c family protein
MHFMTKLSCAVLAVLIGVSTLIAQAHAQAADAARGHGLFMKRGCYLCHGTVGQGGNAGPHLAPGTMPYQAFSAFVRTPPNQMPPFSEKVLSESELRAIHAYLLSLPKPRPADSIKLLPNPGVKGTS